MVYDLLFLLERLLIALVPSIIDKEDEGREEAEEVAKKGVEEHLRVVLHSDVEELRQLGCIIRNLFYIRVCIVRLLLQHTRIMHNGIKIHF